MFLFFSFLRTICNLNYPSFDFNNKNWDYWKSIRIVHHEQLPRFVIVGVVCIPSENLVFNVKNLIKLFGKHKIK